MILGRKFFVALCAIVFNRSPSFQMAACLLVLFVSFGLQVRLGELVWCWR